MSFARLRDLTQQFANDVPNDGSLLYRAIVLGQLKGLEDHIRDHLSAAEMDRFFAGPVRGAAFVAAVPTAKVLAELEFVAAQNPMYSFRQHDRYDLLGMALTLPYADVVWFDKHWTSLASRTGLDVLYGTKIIRRPSELKDILDELG